MCGIAGLLDSPDGPAPSCEIGHIIESLRHRGPDGAGTVSWSRTTNELDLGGRAGNFVGVSTRLAILDLSAASDQPMTDPDGRCALLYNGELYNHAELRDRLQQAGHTFRSTGDTEVVLRAYVEWGTAAFGLFDGMFALAILDRRDRSLVLARDHLGIKPLYVSSDGDSLAFASELPTIRLLRGRADVANPSALFDYLALGWTDHSTETLITGVTNFPPGHLAVVDLDGPASIDPRPYWEPPTEPAEVCFKSAVAGLRELFLQSVRLQLRSDVPVGVMLSGGIDSSALLGATRAVLGEDAGQITAYGYDAATPELSERRWMEMAAHHNGAGVRVERYDDQHVFADLERMIEIQGEPVTSTSVFAQRHLYACMADDGIKVAIGGQGADELFAGYHLLRQRMVLSALRDKRPHDAMRLLTGIHPTASVGELEGELRRRRKTGAPDLERHKLRSDWFRDRGVDVERTLTHQVPENLHAALRDLARRHSLSRLLRFDDRNAMSVSIENRVPYLSKPLVEFAMALPARFLLSPFGSTKFVLREATRDLIPIDIWRRHDKIGFATPEAEMFRNHNKEFIEMFDQAGIEGAPFLDVEAARAELELAAGGKVEFDTRLWRWVNILVWLRQSRVALP